MKWSYKKSLCFLPLCLILFNSSVYGKDDDATDNMGTPPNFSTHCRLADPIAGDGGFQFQWDPSNINNRLSFDVVKKLVRFSSTGPTHPGPAMDYVFVKPGGVGSYGALAFKDYKISFPVIPFGTIRGETGQYLIGALSRGTMGRGIYLCDKSLKDELQD